MMNEPQAHPQAAAPTPDSHETRAHSGEPYPLRNIKSPHPHDVLCGRGGETNHHIGNIQWRAVVAANVPLYVALPKRQKMLVAESIVRAVRSQNPPGRFLKRDQGDGTWHDVGDRKAQEKTSARLREEVPDFRQGMEDDQMVTVLVSAAVAGTGKQQQLERGFVGNHHMPLPPTCMGMGEVVLTKPPPVPTLMPLAPSLSSKTDEKKEEKRTERQGGGDIDASVQASMALHSAPKKTSDPSSQGNEAEAFSNAGHTSCTVNSDALSLAFPDDSEKEGAEKGESVIALGGVPSLAAAAGAVEQPADPPATSEDVPPPSPPPSPRNQDELALVGGESTNPRENKCDRCCDLEQVQRRLWPLPRQAPGSATAPSVLLPHQHPHLQHGVTFAPRMATAEPFDSSENSPPPDAVDNSKESMCDPLAFEPRAFPPLDAMVNAATQHSQSSLIDSDDEGGDDFDRLVPLPFDRESVEQRLPLRVVTESEDEKENSNSVNTRQRSPEGAAAGASQKATLRLQSCSASVDAAISTETTLLAETSHGSMTISSIGDDPSLQSMSISRDVSRTYPLLELRLDETDFWRETSLAFSDMSISRGPSLSVPSEVASPFSAPLGTPGRPARVSQGVDCRQAKKEVPGQGEHGSMMLSVQEDEFRNDECSGRIEGHDAADSGVDGCDNEDQEERESLERLFLGRGPSLASESFGPESDSPS